MKTDVIEKVRQAGVVGAGGAGFPTHVKLANRVEIVLANGTECEPLLKSDQYLMKRHAEEVLVGVTLEMDVTMATQGIIAVKKAYTGVIAAFERLLPNYENIRLHLFEGVYPAGDEFVTVFEATGRQVPEGGLPLEVGVLVQNVTTLYNISQAMKGVPVTHRFVTVTGEVAEPSVLRVPIGSSYGDLIAWCGGYVRDRWSPAHEEADLRLVSGGPMMGRLVGLDDVVTKTDTGLFVLPATNVTVRYMERTRKSWLRRGMSTCDQCRDCTDLCPRYLLGHELQPHMIMRAINYGMDTLPRTLTAAMLCCECRLCEAYACPLELSPMAYYISVKKQLREQGFKNTIHRRRDLTPHSMREFRKVPVRRLVDKLGLTKYRDYDLPFVGGDRVPGRVSIPLQQHIGAQARSVVKVRDRVSSGDLIGSIPEGALGANIHASISGRVVEVGRARIVIASG